MNRRIIFSVCLTAGILTGVAMLSAQADPASSATSMRSAVEGSRWDLWRCHIQPPTGKEDSAGLAEALRRLKSVRFQAKSSQSAKAEDSSSGSSSRPTSQPTATTQPGRIGPEILTKLKQLSPDSITDPAALADTLFLSGYLESAAFFYEMAMENETEAEERAWLLFQAANCYRKASPSAAVKAYGKLLAEHPNSLWSSTAYMPRHIIEWRKANNLDDLLGELQKRTQQKDRSTARKNNE